MRRVQIVAVILALLATPLALLARALSCESSTCTMTCCLPHGHAGPATCHCSKSGTRLPDFGRIAPIAPTAPEDFAAIDGPDFTHQPILSHSSSTAEGFRSAPFNPPRA
jgi:hypothetical protein